MVIHVVAEYALQLPGDELIDGICGNRQEWGRCFEAKGSVPRVLHRPTAQIW